MIRRVNLIAAFLTMFIAEVAFGQQPAAGKEGASFTRKEDVIYGRKFGTALTMDVFTPTMRANGGGVVFAVSGGWFSDRRNMNIKFIDEFLKRRMGMTNGLKRLTFLQKWGEDPDNQAILPTDFGGVVTLRFKDSVQETFDDLAQRLAELGLRLAQN